MSEVIEPYATPTASPDAELIRTCHRFAESELEKWYRYVTDDDQDWNTDWDTYHWIVATPAATPEGLHAKALAYSAFDRDSYDDHEDCTPHSAFLASLLRDMVAPARNAIIADLAAKYGPLPSGYTSEGIWIGLTPEELEAIRAEIRIVQPIADPALRATFKAEKQELIGVDEDGNMSLWTTGNVEPIATLECDNAGLIESGHYVIEWKSHAITVHLGNVTNGLISVLFMCSGGGTLYMKRREVEAMLLGKVMPDPDTQSRISEGLKAAIQALRDSQRTPDRQRGRIFA